MEKPFLDPNYEKPASQSNYYKFASGDNRFRILSPAITGWLDWQDKKPIRTKERPETLVDPAKPAKHFWAFAIYDYRDKTVKILEITQSTIQDAIYNLHSEEGWGNPIGYDLNVKKTGEKMETKYSVVPTPPKPLDQGIIEFYKSLKINLDELYENGDPFNSTKEPEPEMPETFLQSDGLTDEQKDSI